MIIFIFFFVFIIKNVIYKNKKIWKNYYCNSFFKFYFIFYNLVINCVWCNFNCCILCGRNWWILFLLKLICRCLLLIMIGWWSNLGLFCISFNSFCNGRLFKFMFSFWNILECVEMIFFVLFFVICKIVFNLELFNGFEKILCLINGIWCFCNYVWVFL